MEQTIYADILFLIDVSMDFLALYLCAYLLKIRFCVGKALFGAVIGAIYSTLSVIMKFQSFAVTCVVSVLMCFAAYMGNGIIVKLKALPVFYATNMLLGGIMTALFNAFNLITDGEQRLIIFGKLSTVQTNMPLLLFYFCFAAVVLGIAVAKKLFKNVPASSPLEITVMYGKNTVKFKVLEDSGNKLCEPISGEPIIFLKEKTVRALGGDELVSALKMKNEFYNGSRKHKYRVVIYKTVSENDICVCVRADNIILNKKSCGAWIAIGKNLNGDTVDGLVPSSLLR